MLNFVEGLLASTEILFFLLNIEIYRNEFPGVGLS
jgi:hypothetical protein